MQGAEPLVSFRRGPSAWRRCKVGKSASSGQPLYNSRRRRPARRTVRVSANLSRTWSSGSVSLNTAVWSAQGSVSPVRQKPAP